MTGKEETIMLRAVADVMRDRLARTIRTVVNKIDVPEVKVFNEVQAAQNVVHVDVDMAPVAAALDRMTEATTATGDLIRQLIQALSQKPAMEFKPTVNVPKAEVHVSAPNVRVDAPSVKVEVPERKKRKLKITHDDGSTSTIQEE